MNSNSSLPFSQVKTLKHIGINKQNPFCSIVSEGKLIYTCGANVVMQNTKTNQQKILFNNCHPGQIQLIYHHITLYNEHLLSIAIKESVTQIHMVIIVPLNSILFNIDDKKNKIYRHYLKNLGEFEQIKQIQFFDQGSTFAVVSQFQNLTNLTMVRTISGQIFHQQSFINANISIESICLNKLNCASVLRQNKRGQINICLIVLDEISRKLYYNLNLQKGEKVVQYYYESYQEDNILIVLTDLGYILIHKINQYEITLINRVDVRKQKNKSQRKTIKEFQLLEEKDYFMPSLIQSASNKIIVAYQQSCIIGVLFYSHYNPKHTKFSFIDEALNHFNFAKQIKSLRMAKDNCSLAVLIEIHPQTMVLKKDASQSPLVTEHNIKPFLANLSEQFEQDQQESLVLSNFVQNQYFEDNQQEVQNKYYIAVQIDILSNMIDHEDQPNATSKTFSLFAAHNTVLKVQYCSFNNTMFLLMKNKMLKYYDLTPKQMSSKFQGATTLYKDFTIEGLLLWQKLLTCQPTSMTIHPFNYSILLIYQQLLKFHYYNIKNLFPAFIITNVKNCNLAKYSPLGDKIILATSGAIIVLNSYTYQVMKTIVLPTITSENSIKRRISNMPQKIHSNSKLITDLLCLKNGDLLIFSGQNTFSLVLNYQKTAHFGFIDVKIHYKYRQLIYDSVNNLIILIQQDQILILAKSNLNSKNKCQLISKIQISASSAYLVAQIGVLFIGGQNGVLHTLKWPDYCQQELYMRTTNKYHQFRQPIVNISLSVNLSYIYTISKSGCLCISELIVNCDDDKMSKQVKNILLKASEIPLRKGNRWLISRYEEQRKERQIIKLRGQEADKVNNYGQMLSKEQEHQQQLIQQKKIELEAAYTKEIKYYEQHLGLQKYLQTITMLRDQIKIYQRKKRREAQQLYQQKQQKLKQIFHERSVLEQQFLLKEQENKIQITHILKQNESSLQSLMKDLDYKRKEGELINKNEIQKQGLSQLVTKQTIGNLQEDYQQQKILLTTEHEQQLNELLELNQNILSKNRSKKITIHNYQDKISDLNIQKEKLSFDMQKIKNQKEMYKQLKQKLISQNEHHKKIYDRLIKHSKELQQKVIEYRRKEKQYYYKIQTLEEEVTSLMQHQCQLSTQYNQLNDDFLQQTQTSQIKTNQIAQCNIKLQNLKETKKMKNYQNYALKNHYFQIVKTMIRHLQIDQVKAAQEICQQYKSPTFQKQKESVRSNQFEALKVHHEKLAQDATKWKEVKQNYVSSFYRNHRKLQRQNLKLTYRYNDLLRLSQQYKVQISSIQDQIQKAKKTKYNGRKSLPKVLQPRHVQSELIRTNFSFINTNKKGNKQNKINIKKKLICVSLHQQSGKFVTEV